MRLLITFLIGALLFFAGFLVSAQRNNPVYYFLRSMVITARPWNPQEVAHWKTSVAHFKSLHTKADVVMLGDSITANARWKEMLPGVNIANRGIAGDGVDGVLARLDDVIAMQPKVVFLMAGINDLRNAVPPDHVIATLKQIIDRLSAANIQVELQPVLFTADPSTNPNIARTDAALKNYCATVLHCAFIDLNRRIAPEGVLPPAMTLDGMHLTASAYETWHDEIAPTAYHATGRPIPISSAQIP